MAHGNIRPTQCSNRPDRNLKGYQARIPLASALSTRLTYSPMETIQFAALQWPEVFLVFGGFAVGALVIGLLLYTVIRLCRK